MDWATYEAAAREVSQIPSAVSDTVAELWFDAAVAQADLYLEYDQETLLKPVELGVYEYMAEMHRCWGTRSGLISSRTGDLAETYSALGIYDSAFRAAKQHWQPIKPDLLGDGV